MDGPAGWPGDASALGWHLPRLRVALLGQVTWLCCFGCVLFFGPSPRLPVDVPGQEELSIGKIRFKAFDLGGHETGARAWAAPGGPLWRAMLTAGIALQCVAS